MQLSKFLTNLGTAFEKVVKAPIEVPAIAGEVALKKAFGKDTLSLSERLSQHFSPLETTALRAEYVGEHLGESKAFPGQKVRYLSAKERETFKLHVREGHLYDHQGNLFDTRGRDTGAWGGQNRVIFVYSPDGELYASPFTSPGMFHHSSLIGGQEVAMAGELQVFNGKVHAISNKSGHYRPDVDQLYAVVERLEKLGIFHPEADVEPVNIGG